MKRQKTAVADQTTKVIPVVQNDKNIKNIVDIYKEIEDNKECYTIKNLKINGNDILSLGYKNKEVGQMLNKILYEVIKNPKLNNKDQIIEKYTKSN